LNQFYTQTIFKFSTIFITNFWVIFLSEIQLFINLGVVNIVQTKHLGLSIAGVENYHSAPAIVVYTNNFFSTETY